MTFSPLRMVRKSILRSVPKVKGSDQKVVTIVMQGFRATLEDDRFEVLVPRLNEIEPAFRGFAYEGVGLGLTVFDCFLPWRKRLQAFVGGPGEPYIIPIYIGAGLALGRIGGRRIEHFVSQLEHPVFRWMVVDGYGFYKGFFARRRYLEEQTVPTHLSGYSRCVFDQGLGRSIWFATGENVDQVSTTIAALHMYPTYVGVGLALARLHRQPERFLKRLDPVLGWVIIDGYGFHEGFFSRRRSIEGQVVPRHLSGYGRRLFDQGLGRAIWFSNGGLVDRVAATIAPFDPDIYPDLWSGVGLASAYAGGANRATLEKVLSIAKPYQFQLAHGAATAAKGRLDAGIQAPHTDLACQVYCGLSSEEAVRILSTTSQNLPTTSLAPAYEIWRQRTQAQLVPR